jgi:transposase
VWNTGLEQRREYRRRGAYISYVEQARQVAEAKPDHPWLADAPSHTLQQTLRDLDRACQDHGTWKVRWRSKSRCAPSFRFPDPKHIQVARLSRRWGQVKLPKLGWVRFRWTRPIGGTVRNATVLRDGGRWYVCFCVEDGVEKVEPNGKPPVGVDRGVAVAVATSDGWMREREFVTPGEAKRLKRRQQQLSRQKNKRSNRRKATRAKVTALNARVRARRTDFAAWTANRLTKNHSLVVVENLKVGNMTRSAKGTIEQPGRNVRQKAGLNRAILAKGWGAFILTLEHVARYHGAEVVQVKAAYTSQTCNACKHVAPESRESQAVFRCVACGHQDNADVNAAKNILAAGLAVTGRGDLGDARSVKRQPPELVAA